MSHLQISALRKSYGDTVVLDGLDLELDSGEFCTVVGASGCGKSTLLRSILGLVTPAKGTVRLRSRQLVCKGS